MIYYVKNGGNNSLNGQSDGNAWSTIAYVNGKTFNAGDQILFKKGSTWSETLVVPSSGSPGSPITFGSYSTGANPLIDVAGGQANCITLTGRSFITIDGIDCKNATAYGIASPSSPGTNIIIKNLTVSYIGTTNTDLQHGIFQQGGYLTVDHCTVTQISHCGIMFGGSHNTITNNNISYTNLHYTGWGAGINGTSSSDDISYNVIDNCGGVGEATKTHGIYVGLTNSNVHHNTITNSTKGSGIKAVAGGNYYNNYISGSYLSGIETGQNGSTSGTSVTVRIYYNIFTGNRQAISESAQGTGPFTLEIYNNVCYYNNSTLEDSYYSEIALDENINTSLIIKNNILFGYGRYTYAFNTAQTHAAINNNCVYQASGNLIYYNGGTRTWSDWQGYGFDTNGKNVNPNMVSPPSNCRLQVGSQCINTGLNVGLTLDYAGQSVSSPPEIGAFEYATIGTIYYVSTTGNNGNPGTSGSPFRDVWYACSVVNGAGDIIHVNAGSYTETNQWVLDPGVSIEGAGMGSTIITSSVADTLIYLSSVQGTNGNQHISDIYFNGDNTTLYALRSYGRSNVSIYSCLFTDFVRYGLMLFGNADGQAESTSVTYATGISVHNCTITNCAYYQHGIGGGADIFMACLQDPQFYNNTITQNKPLNGSGWNVNGCGIKTDGWTKGVTIYNNTLIGNETCDAENTTDSWDFAIEMWGDVGSITEGIHIYGNTIYNWYIDISGRITRPGSYSFGCSIHDNVIGGATLPSVAKYGIWLEANTSIDGMYIYNNIIKNCVKPIYLYVTNQAPLPTSFSNFYIYNNLIHNVGINVSGFDDGNGITWRQATGTTNTVSNINIYHNVIVARPGGSQWNGISFVARSGVTASNFNVKNNIIVGFDNAPIGTSISWMDGSGSISSLNISNNIFFTNGNSNTLQAGSVSLPSYTNANNLTSDPTFVSAADFHLQAGSPAIGHGVAVAGVTTDFSGNTYGSPPSIGAYEYGTFTPIPVTLVVVSAVGGVNAISVNHGTLQMIATIYPEDATDKTVVWSVVGTGATISQTGLLTATGNGTVTVKATSNG